MKKILFSSLLFLLAEFSFAEELTNYTITSDSQIYTLEGDLEAIGNVVIKSNSGNFEAYSDKLSFDKDDKSLKLIGNVFVKNLESEGIAIQDTFYKLLSDENQDKSPALGFVPLKGEILKKSIEAVGRIGR